MPAAAPPCFYCCLYSVCLHSAACTHTHTHISPSRQGYLPVAVSPPFSECSPKGLVGPHSRVPLLLHGHTRPCLRALMHARMLRNIILSPYNESHIRNYIPVHDYCDSMHVHIQTHIRTYQYMVATCKKSHTLVHDCISLYIMSTYKDYKPPSKPIN